MRVLIYATGRMKAGPERDLAERYLDRFAKSGPSLGLEFAGVTEAVESRLPTATARMREEGSRLRDAAGGGPIILLDERGKDLSSDAFAAFLARQRDGGVKSLLLGIGGPDGHDPDLRSQAAALIAYGSATWPHQMVRIMLAEQLYRATTILSGHPYHRA